jgi:hypothetical protein
LRQHPPIISAVMSILSAAAGCRPVGILGLAVTLATNLGTAQTVKVYHGGTYARTGQAMTVALTGQNPTDQLVVTLNGAQVYQQSGPLSTNNIVDFSFGGRAAGSYTMVTALETSSGTVRASTSESIKLYNTGSVTIDQWNNLVVSGTPFFPLTLWMDATNPRYFSSYYAAGQVNGWGWIDDWESGYSATEYANSIVKGASVDGQPSFIADSPKGVIGPGGNNAGVITGLWPTTTYHSGVATAYVTNSTISNDTLMWYWTDEPDNNLAPYGTNPCSLGSGTGCDQLISLLNEVHANDPNHRPQIVDFYGYYPPSVSGRGYAPPNVSTDVMSYDHYPYIQSHKRASNGICPGPVGTTDMGGCVATIAQWVQLMEYFRSNMFYDSVPMMPVIEGGGEADGTSSLCPGPNSCPSLNGNQWGMEAYLGIIHGARGYALWTAWASGNAAPPSSVLTAEASFLTNIKNFMGTVIAQPPTRTVTSNQTAPGARVDAMTRDQGGFTWVIAQRLTDDIANPSEATASPLATQFTVSGLTGTQSVTVYGESRTLTGTNGVFTDNFAPYAHHVYQISSGSGLAAPSGLQAIVQ